MPIEPASDCVLREGQWKPVGRFHTRFGGHAHFRRQGHLPLGIEHFSSLNCRKMEDGKCSMANAQ
jgi:hypothetical protein